MDNISAKAQSIERAAPQMVFDAFVDAEKMSKFWFTRRDDGLQEGKSVSWFVGPEKNALAIEVNVQELKKPELIKVEWGGGDQFTQVIWKLEKTEIGNTILTIEEFGFAGSADQIISSALDSTGGFNQFIIALKAFLEHDANINVVEDHV